MRVRRQIRQEIPLLRRSLSSLPESEQSSVQSRLLIFRDPERFLFRPLEVTTGIGVKIFVYTCAVKSLFALTITFFADAPFHINLSKTLPWALQLLPHMDGAAFMTSTIESCLCISKKKEASIFMKESQINWQVLGRVLGSVALRRSCL